MNEIYVIIQQIIQQRKTHEITLNIIWMNDGTSEESRNISVIFTLLLFPS